MYKSDYIITSKHYLILSVLALAAGIYVTAGLNGGILFVAAVFLTALFAVLTILLLMNSFKKFKSKRIKHLLLPLVLIFFFIMGILRVFTAELFFPGVLKDYVGKEVWLSGTVVSSVTESKSGYSSYFEFEAVQIDSQSIKPETVIIYISKTRGSLLAEGDEICCWTALSSPVREDITDSFDYYTHLRGRNIFLVGEVQNTHPANIKKPVTLVSAIQYFGFAIKNKTSEAVDALLYDSPTFSAILKGILVGDKSGFSDELYNKFSYAGLSHIVSVSGMHLSILFSVLTLLMYFAHTHKKLACILAIPAIVLLSSAAEFSPSVCRSAIMVLVMIAAMLLGKRYTPINALFLSLGVILITAPYSLFSKSLILSFGATLGILVFFGYINRLLKKLFPIPKTKHPKLNKSFSKSAAFLSSSLAISVAAFLGTAYASAVFFGSVSWIQLLTNLWVIPAVTAVFCMGFLACILYFIFPHLTLAVFYYPLRFFLWIISATADTFGTSKFAFQFNSEAIPSIAFVIYLGAVIIVYMLLKLFEDMQKEKAAKH